MCASGNGPEEETGARVSFEEASDWRRRRRRRQRLQPLIAVQPLGTSLHLARSGWRCRAPPPHPRRPLLMRATVWKGRGRGTKSGAVRGGGLLQLGLRRPNPKHSWVMKAHQRPDYFSYCSTPGPLPLIYSAGLNHPADIQSDVTGRAKARDKPLKAIKCKDNNVGSSCAGP